MTQPGTCIESVDDQEQCQVEEANTAVGNEPLKLSTDHNEPTTLDPLLEVSSLPESSRTKTAFQDRASPEVIMSEHQSEKSRLATSGGLAVTAENESIPSDFFGFVNCTNPLSSVECLKAFKDHFKPDKLFVFPTCTEYNKQRSFRYCWLEQYITGWFIHHPKMEHIVRCVYFLVVTRMPINW